MKSLTTVHSVLQLIRFMPGCPPMYLVLHTQQRQLRFSLIVQRCAGRWESKMNDTALEEWTSLHCVWLRPPRSSVTTRIQVNTHTFHWANWSTSQLVQWSKLTTVNCHLTSPFNYKCQLADSSNPCPCLVQGRSQ